MKNIKFFAMAAMMAIGLASCAKDQGTNVPNADGPSTESKIGITLELPANYFAPETRADQEPISPNEVYVNTIHVWVFNNNGSTSTAGHFTSLNPANDFDTSNNVMTQNKNWVAVTASQNAKVYVGINVPGAAAVADEAALKQLFDDVADLSASLSFAMFSGATAATLIPYVTGDDTTLTEVAASVERIVSKLVGTTETATMTPTTAFNTTDGVTLSYAIKKYNVYNEALDSYLVRQNITKSTLNNFDASYLKGASSGNGNKDLTVMAESAFGTDRANLTGLTNMFYIGENNSKLAAGAGGLSLVGKTTYAFVATQVTVNKTATWDATANSGEGGVVWTGASNVSGSTYSDLYILKLKNQFGYTGEVLLCLQAGKDALEAALTVDDYDMYTYKDSYVHFLVWLNKESTNDYNIARNQFIHLHVEGVNGADNLFPGYPGEPTDSEKPIDPTKDTNNPDPKDATDPVDEIDAQLKVTITIKPWEYKANHVILNR